MVLNYYDILYAAKWHYVSCLRIQPHTTDHAYLCCGICIQAASIPRSIGAYSIHRRIISNTGMSINWQMPCEIENWTEFITLFKILKLFSYEYNYINRGYIAVSEYMQEYVKQCEMKISLIQEIYSILNAILDEGSSSISCGKGWQSEEKYLYRLLKFTFICNRFASNFYSLK